MIEIKQLIWDEWNVGHIKKHKVGISEVEEACKKPKRVLKSYEGRLLILGQIKRKRWLSIVLAPKGRGKYYVVTARDVSKKEKRLIK